MTTSGPVVRVELTVPEAERIYASAISYESIVNRIVAVEETEALAHTALTKLAQAIVNAARPGDAHAPQTSP